MNQIWNVYWKLFTSLLQTPSAYLTFRFPLKPTISFLQQRSNPNPFQRLLSKQITSDFQKRTYILEKTRKHPFDLLPTLDPILFAIFVNYSCDIKFVNDAIIIYSLPLKKSACYIFSPYMTSVPVNGMLYTFLLSLFSSTVTVILNGTHGRKAMVGKK